MTFEEIDEFFKTAPRKPTRPTLFPGSLPPLGIRLPLLRREAKKITVGDVPVFVTDFPETSLESQILKAYVIGMARCPLHETLVLIDCFLPRVHDWAVNDALCSSLKMTKKHQKEVMAFLKEKSCVKTEFYERFIAVMLMCYFLDDQYIEETLNLLKKLKCEKYYTQMGVAWALATALIRYPDRVYRSLLEHQFSDVVIFMTIKKACESYRISDEWKETLKQLRLKMKGVSFHRL